MALPSKYNQKFTTSCHLHSCHQLAPGLLPSPPKWSLWFYSCPPRTVSSQCSSQNDLSQDSSYRSEPILPSLQISHFTQRKAKVFAMICSTVLQGSVLFSSLELPSPLSSQSSPVSLVSCYFLNITGTYSVSICTDCSLCLGSSSLNKQELVPSYPSGLYSKVSFSVRLPLTTLFKFHHLCHTSHQPCTLGFYFRAINFIPHIIYFTYVSYFCIPVSRGM